MALPRSFKAAVLFRREQEHISWPLDAFAWTLLRSIKTGGVPPEGFLQGT
jgi:hypothetical protein